MTEGGRPKRKARKRAPALDAKMLPAQLRSQDTYEHILETAGKLLAHVGFEEITTNLICREADMTPPALYRYFPNKYAILKILGERLIAVQDAIVAKWLASEASGQHGPEEPVGRIVSVLHGLIDVTKAFPGGIAINRAIHAVPLLRQLHIASREAVASQIYDLLQPQFPAVSETRMRAAARLVSELSSALMEMVMEEPGQDTEGLVYEAAFVFASYFRALRGISS
jgi:AcrR family transcriptional regulator